MQSYYTIIGNITDSAASGECVTEVDLMATQAVTGIPMGGSAMSESVGLPELRSYIESGKNSLKIVVSGKMGVGKSTLINGLVGKDVAHEAQSPLTVTSEIKEYKLKIKVTDSTVKKSVDVTIVDCPGLGDPVNDEDANLTEISKQCQDADLLIYCLDMRGRMTKADTEGMREFNKRVGSNIWKNAMFVLTFANEVPSAPKPAGWLSYLSFGYFGSEDSERKKGFVRLLKEWNKTIAMFLKDKMKLPEEIVTGIPIVPAGYRKFPPADRTDWFSEFWFTALCNVKEEAQPSLVGINLHRWRISSSDSRKQPDVDNNELPINIPVTAGKVGGAVVVGTGGGVALGAIIGAAIGTVGGPAGTAIGAYAGALAGAGIGVASGGGAGAVAGLAVIVRAVQKHAEKLAITITSEGVENGESVSD